MPAVRHQAAVSPQLKGATTDGKMEGNRMGCKKKFARFLLLKIAASINLFFFVCERHLVSSAKKKISDSHTKPQATG